MFIKKKSYELVPHSPPPLPSLSEGLTAPGHV